MTHIQKWTEVCEEMKIKYPHSNATIWISGYVFGLKYLVSTEYHSQKCAENVSQKCTLNQQDVNRGPDDQ